MRTDEMFTEKWGEKDPRKVIKILSIVLAVALLVMVGGYAISLFVDYIQVREIGKQFTGNFWTNFNVKIISQALSLLIIFLMFFTTNVFLKKEILRENPSWAYLKKQWIWVLLSLVISFIGSSFIRDSIYSRFLMFANATNFNLSDPLFYQDIGYYMFSRPFLKALVDSLSSIFGFITIYTVAIYFLLAARFQVNNVSTLLKNHRVLWHNIINVSLWSLMVIFSYKFRMEGVLFNQFDNLSGAGFIDVKVWATFYRIVPFVFVLAIIGVIIFALRKKYKWAVISFLVIPTLFVVAMLTDAAVNVVIVAPNELGVQSEYIQNNMNMTRQAYGLDKITERTFDLTDSLNKDNIDESSGIIDNIRITDFKATLTALNKLQTIKPYYSFKDTDMVPYTINGKNTILSIAARELDKAKLAQTTDTYVNNIFKYTHGYGAVANPINTVTDQGQPVFSIKDIPIDTEKGMPKIKQPRIYYGEMTNDHVIVNSKISELDYSNDKSYTYNGTSGIKLNFFNKVMFSMIYGDYKMLISNQITNQSRILPNRNIVERAKKVAPFLEYDEDPYMIIDGNGRLKWVLDAYTTSSYYPYAQKMTDSSNNYIRNSIKVIIDAYDGTPKFYITDYSDPIAVTYEKIYPKMFEDGKIPSSIAKHVRYPEKLFTIQSQMYRRYHVTDSTTFYSQQDLWEIAKERYNNNETRAIEPYYNMMQIDGLSNGTEQMILTLPYTLKNRDYITSWLAVGSDSTNYGKMVVYKFKFQTEDQAYGTMQIENRIDNDPSISSEMTLWGQGGSNVIRGNMLVVPIKNSLLYVEPVYITTNNEASFPELKRVIVAYGDKIAMGATLKDSLATIFGTDKSTNEKTRTVTPSTTGGAMDGNLQKIIALYDQYKKYNAANDYQNAGSVMKQIDDLVTSLQK